MLRFEKINIHHTQIISRAVALAKWSSCQLSSISLFGYAEKYKTEVCVSNGFAFIKQNRPKVCYFLPIPASGIINSQNELDESLKLLLQYHKNHTNCDFVIWGVADDMLGSWAHTLKRNGLTELVPDRDWAEYMHLSENLVYLKGRRFHAKRNSVNQFIRGNRDYCYVPLDRSTIDEAVGFQAQLLNEARQSDIDQKTISDLETENISILKGFQHFESLNLTGGIIRVNGKICAFGFGGMINLDTFDLAFEKASKNYNGIYQVLEQEMFKNNAAIKYVNREEDLGIERLRFAKEKLRPDTLLFKRSFVLPADKPV